MTSTSCTNCDAQRKPTEPGYQPMQIVLGLPVGWWSVPKEEGQPAEELCGPCISTLLLTQIGEQS